MAMSIFNVDKKLLIEVKVQVSHHWALLYFSVENEEFEVNLVEHLQNLQLSENVDSRKSCQPEFEQRVSH